MRLREWERENEREREIERESARARVRLSHSRFSTLVQRQCSEAQQGGRVPGDKGHVIEVVSPWAKRVSGGRMHGAFSRRERARERARVWERRGREGGESERERKKVSSSLSRRRRGSWVTCQSWCGSWYRWRPQPRATSRSNDGGS